MWTICLAPPWPSEIAVIDTAACLLLTESAEPAGRWLNTPFRNDANVSGADASRLAALLVGQMLPAFFLLAPCDPGASTPEYVTVNAKLSTSMTTALYRIEHETRYRHAGRASTSQHVAYLTPRELPRQRLHAHDLIVEPAPVESDPAHRLLREHGGAVHHPHAVRRDARGQPKPGRGAAVRRRTSIRRERGVGGRPGRAALQEERRVSGGRPVQLSVAVRDPGSGAGRVCRQVVRSRDGRSWLPRST